MILLVLGVACAGCTNTPPAQNLQSFWSSYPTVSVGDGVTLYYARELEKDSKQIKASAEDVSRSLAGLKDDIRRSREQKLLLVSDVLAIVGVNEEAGRKDALSLFVQLLDRHPLLGKKPVKVSLVVIPIGIFNKLWRDHTTPAGHGHGSTVYTFPIDSGTEELTVPIPIKDDEDVGQAIRNALSGVTARYYLGAALHEVAEWAIVKRLRPKDPYFRWFSDGFANVIALQVLKSRDFPDAARTFETSLVPDNAGDARHRVRLRYWLGVDYQIETALRSENQLEHNRYVYATQLANDVVCRQGIGCVSKILDALKNVDRSTGGTLQSAVTLTTQIDIRAMLNEYQDFDQVEASKILQHHLDSMAVAYTEKRFDVGLEHALRAIELAQVEEYRPDLYLSAAILLFKGGHESLSDNVLEKQLKVAQKSTRLPILKAQIDYAWAVGSPQKGYVAADEILSSERDNVPALATRLHRIEVDPTKRAEAIAIAHQVIDNDLNLGSIFRTYAQRVLKNLNHQ